MKCLAPHQRHKERLWWKQLKLTQLIKSLLVSSLSVHYEAVINTLHSKHQRFVPTCRHKPFVFHFAVSMFWSRPCYYYERREVFVVVRLLTADEKEMLSTDHQQHHNTQTQLHKLSSNLIINKHSIYTTLQFLK